MPATRQEALAELRQAQDEARVVFEKVPEAAVSFSPAGEEWTVGQIIFHVGGGYRFRETLYQAARAGSAASVQELFGQMRSAFEAAKQQSRSALLTALSDRERQFLAFVDQYSPEDDATVFSLETPRGRREVSMLREIEHMAAHNREHRQQVLDWLARRPSE